MLGVRAAAVGDAVAVDLAAGEVDEVEARLARRLARSRRSPIVSRARDLVLVERRLGASEQLRIDAGGSGRNAAGACGGCRKRRERVAARSRRRNRPGSICELADDDRTAPAAAIAPKPQHLPPIQ